MGKSPRRVIIRVCSTGGAQGFALAQYHPELFDGIIAGTPGNWYSHLALSFQWNAQKTSTNSSFLSQALLNLTGKAVLKACDALDGVEDGVIENPLKCDFDITSLACGAEGAKSSACLTEEQIKAAKAIYAGPVNAQTGAQLYPGFDFGSEVEWALQEGILSNAFAVPILQNLVYDDLEYEAERFNWASDVKDAEEKAGGFIDEIAVDLTAFRKRGGKLLVTQGWADPFNAATWPIQHMDQIKDFFGGDISDFFNLFMIPGGDHCGPASSYPSVPSTYHSVPHLVS
ncbi:Tannase/feruloyl esterase [Clohesyomyces aquaticus]|uniref:Carboxylic ester hydrolase n=1 Tax=Clohesyomyces aquaticus TaxID=1231657 RepID=A0A1Y2A126_9PLEO|nr:Tannase/feruloyl esterase [Clohesyomyces aquaticus]